MANDKEKDSKTPGDIPGGSAIGKARASVAGSPEVVKDPRGRKSKAQAEAEKTLDSLLTPDNVRHIVALPFDLAYASTGSDVWELSPEEEKTLAVSGAACLKEFGISDPKWLSISFFAIALLKIGGAKWAAYSREQKEKKKTDEAKPAEKA